jgi:hypothetical protein
MVQFDTWCDSADVPLGSHHVRILTGRPVHATVAGQTTAAEVPARPLRGGKTHCPALQRLGKPAAAQLIIDSLPRQRRSDQATWVRSTQRNGSMLTAAI